MIIEVEIDHVVKWRKPVKHQVDLDDVRQFLDLADDEPVSSEHLIEYFEGELESGDPVTWVPNVEYAEGYEFDGVEVWDVSGDGVAPNWDDKHDGSRVEVVAVDPQYV